MSVNRWNPANEAMTLREAMDRLFQDSFVRMPRPEGGSAGQHLIPPADAWEDQDEIVIELALPGATAENVDVTFENDSVTVSGHLDAPREGKHYILRERAAGPFQRRFNLAVPISVERVEATFNNGLLRLRLPKSEAVKPRKISVKAS